MFDSLNWTDHVGAAFDLAFHGGGLWGKCFFVEVESGWTLEDCEGLLAEYDIGIYGKDIIKGYNLFWVNVWDTQQALDILTRAGVQVGIVEDETEEQ